MTKPVHSSFPSNAPSNTVSALPTHGIHSAYIKLKPELNAMTVGPANTTFLEPALVVQTVLGAVPQVEKLRDAISAELRSFDWQRVTHLRETALALAHLEALKRQGRRDAPSTIVAEARKTRDLRLADAEPLVARSLLSGAAVSNLRHGNSHRQLAIDLLGIANLFDENYAALEGKTLVTRQDIQDARQLAESLLMHLGAKEYTTDIDTELAIERNKLMSLLLADYQEVSAAVHYVRRQVGDGERIVPSLRKIQMQRSGTRGGTSDGEGDTSDAANADANSNEFDGGTDGERADLGPADADVRASNDPTNGAKGSSKGPEIDPNTLDAMMAGTFKPKS